MKLKIVSGTFKGKNINVPQNNSVRPVLTRLRKALVDTIKSELCGASFLDLFGGSGSVSFEVLCNGARCATVIEINRGTTQTIRDNARILGLSSEIEIIHGDVFKVMKEFHNLKRTFDIIYIAPPQFEGLIDQVFVQLHDNRIFHFNTLIITQHHTKEIPDTVSEIFYLERSRRYGNTTFDFYRVKEG